MKKILLSLAATTALVAAAAPAAAQPWRDHGHDNHAYDSGRLNTPYVDSLEWKINNAAREGRISWGEARGLLHQLREVQPLAWRVQTGEANGWERNRLERAVSRIEQAVNRDGYARRGYGRPYSDDRAYGSGYGWRR